MKRALARHARKIIFYAAISLMLGFALFALTDATHAQSDRITLIEAVRQGVVDAQIRGSGDIFFQESLAFRLQNKRPTPITIVIPVGLIFEPDDKSFQGLIVPKEYVIVLCGSTGATPSPAAAPCAGATAQGKWNGFCINLSRHAPDKDTKYHIGQMASGPLLQVVQAVDKKSAAGRLGAQFAVWRVTDDFTLDSINSPDLQNSELMELIRPLLSLARPEIDLAQSILTDSGTGLKFYTGTPPPNLFEPGGLLAPGSRTGIPEVDSLKQQVEDALKTLAIAGGVVGVLCVLACLGVVGLAAFLVLRRK